MFFLAGYTASIIGFPSVAAPGNIFNVAIVREQEIVLGILCTALVHAAFFPRTLTQRLQLRLDEILTDAETWSAKALNGQRDPTLISARAKLGIEVNELYGFAFQLPFDTSRFIPSVRALNALQDQLTVLLPLASAVEDRLTELSQLSEKTSPDVMVLTTRVADWLQAEYRAGHSDTEVSSLVAEVRQALANPIRGSVWGRLLTLNVLSRLEELIEAHRHARELRRYLRGTTKPAASAEILEIIKITRSRSLHRDHLGAAWIGISAGLVVLLGCLFWIATAWSAGAGAVLITAVLAGLFGSLPGAPRIIRRFIGGVIVGIGIAALYGYVVLPRVTDPVMFALVLAPPLLIFGAVLSRPTVGILGLAGIFGFINTVGLGAAYQPDFVSFANSSLGLILGAGLSAAVLSLTQIGTAHFTALRLLKAAYRDVAMRADGRAIDTIAWTSRMLDRIGILSTSQFLKEQPRGMPVIDVLTDMRTGVLAGRLLRLRDDASKVESHALEGVLTGIGLYYLGRSPRHPHPPSGRLLNDIDSGVGLFNLDDNSPRNIQGLSLLTGLRRSLFPSAPPYTPTPG